MVPLARYSADISLDLLSVRVLGSVWPLNVVEARSVRRELSLNDINYHLPLASDAQLGDARASTRLLYTLRQPVVSPDLADLPPQVRRDHGRGGGLAEEDLVKRDNLG